MTEVRITGTLVTGALAAALATAVAATWPVALHLSDHVVDGAEVTAVRTDFGKAQFRADVEQTVWIVNWNLHALATQPLHLFDGTIFYPSPKPLARSEHIFATSLLAIPGALLGGPVFAHQTALLLCGVLDFLAAAYLALVWTRSRAGAAVAGCCYALSGYSVDGLHHLQSMSVGCIPIVLLGVERFCATGSRRYAALGAGALTFQILSGQYTAFWVLLAWCTACAVAVLAGRPGAPRGRQVARDLGWLFAAAVAAGLVVLPFAIPYLSFTLSGEVPRAAPPFNMVFGLRAYAVESPFTPQVRVAPVLWPLALAGAASLGAQGRSGRIRLLMLLAVGLVGTLVSLGPRPGFSLFDALGAVLPGFTSIREPARAAILPHLCISLLAACGISLLAHRSPRIAAAAAAATVAIVFAQQGKAPVPLQALPVPPALPDGYEFLAKCGAGDPLLELPIAAPLVASRETKRMYFGTYHWLPLLNGRASYAPPGSEEIIELASALPDRTALSRLRGRTGLRWIRVDCEAAIPVPGTSRRLCRGKGLPGATAHEFGRVRVFDLGAARELPRAYPQRWEPAPECPASPRSRAPGAARPPTRRNGSS